MNKRTEQTRWTPKRLLSLLMALIMTLSLLPTAALAASDYVVSLVDPPYDTVIVGQESAGITAKLTSTDSTSKNVRLKVTVNQTSPTADPVACTIQYRDTSGAYVTTTNGYLDDGTVSISVSSTSPVLATFKLKFDNPGNYSYTVEAFEWDSTTKTATSLNATASTYIPVKDAIESVAVTPNNPEAGQPFTVRADTNVDNGHVAFTYNGDTKSVPVSPLPDTKGYAEYTFIANTGATGDTAISATLFDTTGILGTKTTGLALATPAANYTVVFRANGDNVYTLPAPQTVKHGQTATEPITPERKGYTFGGWYKDPSCPDTEVAFDFNTAVTDNLELYAKWTATPVTIQIVNAGAALGVDVINPRPNSSIGSEAHFNVKVPAKYDTTDLLVFAGNLTSSYIIPVPVARVETADGVTLYYQFTVTEDLVDPATSTLSVTVSNFIAKTFTVMMPVGHFTAQIKAVDSIGSTKAEDGISASIVHGGDYTFSVTPDPGYTVKRVAVNGATINKNNDGSYTVPDVTTAQTVEVVVDELPVYIVIYNSNNSQYAFQRVTEGSKAALPADPVVEGYTFGGWYTEQNGEGEQFTDATAITGDITVYAKLTANTYPINYNKNTTDDVTNMPTAAQSKTHGQAVKLDTAKPTREGYTFLGWGTSDSATAASYQPGDMYSVDKEITLYAVWEINKYTVTLPGGAGYTTAPTGTNSVDWGSNFTFTVIVDREYAAKEPTVKYSTDGGMNWTVTDGAGAVSNNSAATWTYTIQNVKTNCIVSIDVARNTTYTVSFITATLDNGTVTAGDAFLKQSVEHGYYAPTPAAPEREGFKFLGYYAKKDTATSTMADYESFPFEQQILKDTNIYAIYAPITPAITWTTPITADGYTIEVKGTKAGETTESTLNSGDKVAYGSKVTFTITISTGYDASKMQVGVNGILYAPNEKNGNVYTFEFTAKEDTKITVAGIERKTVTVIYNANARDDVSGLPSPQVVKYYLAALGETGNDKITTQEPKRTGYEFVGWCTDSEATVTVNGDAKTINAKTDGVVVYPGATAPFTTDTTLYAIWLAQDTTLTLKITDAAYDTQQNNRVIQYEGESITLQATLNVNAKGTVVFYKGDEEGNNGTRIGSAAINGKTAELSVKVGDYKAGGVTEHYWAVFESETDEGFANSEKSNIMNVGVFSKAITWPLNTKNADTLTITEATGSMTAGKTYKLTVDITKILGLETVTPDNAPKLGEDYAIVWQYKNTVTGDWADMSAEITDTNEYQVTPEYAGHEYRAKIVPIGDLYTKAAKFDENGIVNNEYDKFLYTNTVGSVLQATATALTITGAETEANNVKINGATLFTADHLAQFEGQAVTLTAKVTKDGGTGVETGKVEFYRLDGSEWKLIGTVNVETQGTNTGVASTTYTMGAYDSTSAGASATTNKETFKAVYVANETYEKSETDGNAAVYIKSAKLMTPIIESELEGTNGAKATTYSKDLTGLLAGVQHTFKLRQDADQTTKDYSVVALDGRTVAAENYDIEWQYKTGANFDKAGNDSAAEKYITTTTKVGDRYRVKLTGKGVFAGNEATSKDAVIGTKQDVTVTVKAIDAITKTPETDVYQLNEITLTATVAAAKGADATMKPAGTVTFYYSVDGTNWTKIGEAKDLAEVAGVMTASIKTDQLPVKANDNTKQDVEITAVYSGDATFNASATVTGTEKYTITAAAGCTTTNDTVTVYSSVVFNCNDENKKQPTDGDKGIHISVSDGAFKTNEKATLALSDIYTLDRELTDETLRNTIAKLNPTTDYIVQWQKLNGATAIGDAEGTDFANSQRWTDIGATGTLLVLDKVEQNTAYRAVITVKDRPITKGSFDKLDQGLIGTADANDGRQVYYSNVLMPTDTNMTVSVALNTSKIGAENTEGITEGETVTANVYLSGVVGAVPNANVTVTVTNDDAKGNGTAGEYKQILGNKNTVNGWNAFDWDTTGVTPGFYTLTVSATTNTGYAAKEITRSLIVRESSYDFEVGNTNPTYNGRTQGLEVTLDGFDFKGTGINEAANKSWTVRYEDANGKLVEPSQAGKYTATITLPASAYWTEQTKTVDFTIEKRSVSIADAIAQAKVYDGTTDVNIVEVMLNDAETDQTTTGLPTNNVGIINGDSIYAVATEAKLSSANAGDNSFTISTIELRGDDAANYVWDNNEYTENIYVSRSQVYGVSSTDVTLKAGEKLPADAVYMIDQAGNKITSYDVLYYLHTDTEIKKVDNTNEKGLYTVIARPKQDNYKSGVTLRVTVGDATGYTDAVAPKPSTLIAISNTAELYGAATGVTASTTNSTATTTIEYQSGSTGWTTTAPTSAGRYLVRVTANTGDVAYGIYTITKAHPSIDVTPATGLTYNSMPQNGYTTLTGVEGKDASKDYYITYAGDVAIGYNTPADGNVDEQAPVDAGTYTVTLHVNETANYTAHEVSTTFTIKKAPLTITADSWQTTQYDAFPDMTAKYEGLAAVDTDTTPDTSLRDVQIAPEYLYNPTNGKSNYNNDTLDQVGYVAIQPIDALSKNYAITYEKGQYTKQRTETNVKLDIHGLPQSSTGKNTVYYGDEIQLYPYGYYTTLGNGSGILEWSVTTATGFKGTVTIEKETGLLNVNGVGEFTVTLKRGVGEQQIKTEINVTAIKKEAKIALKNVDKVYNGASQTYDYTGNVTVHDELYRALPYFDASKVTRTSTDRTNVGTQITTAKVTGAWAYQSETYGGKFTINDKEASVAPVADAHIYGTTRTIPSPAYTSTDSNAISNVLTASQTDAYNRLDVHDGYEILVAGTEDMNYNVKYTTDETAADSAVTTYQDVVFTSKTDKYLNDATIYGETPNVLDWTLVNVIGATRDSVDYADNLADFDLPDTFVEQDKDDCTGNKVTYKAANRTTDAADSSNIRYNQDKLEGPRTSTDTNTDENYTLKFNTVKNSGAANYKLTNEKTGNSEATTNALTANSKGFITPATGESSDVSSENFVEGSANIAQRPIKLEKAVDDVQLYWKLSQKQLYTALVNVLKAEENSVGRGLAKGHTIEDLDLSFTIGSTPVDKNDDQPMNFTDTGKKTVTVTVGDTNYKLEGGQYQFDIVLKNIQIEATYTTKTFTGFTVLIKVHNKDGAITPLNDAKGLSYKIFKKTGNTIDKTTAYASGTLTYQNRTAYDDKGVLCGVFTATYSQLPLLNSGETYFIQMYEYGVELKTNS